MATRQKCFLRLFMAVAPTARGLAMDSAAVAEALAPPSAGCGFPVLENIRRVARASDTSGCRTAPRAAGAAKAMGWRRGTAHRRADTAALMLPVTASAGINIIPRLSYVRRLMSKLHTADCANVHYAASILDIRSDKNAGRVTDRDVRFSQITNAGYARAQPAAQRHNRPFGVFLYKRAVATRASAANTVLPGFFVLNQHASLNPEPTSSAVPLTLLLHVSGV